MINGNMKQKLWNTIFLYILYIIRSSIKRPLFGILVISSFSFEKLSLGAVDHLNQQNYAITKVKCGPDLCPEVVRIPPLRDLYLNQYISVISVINCFSDDNGVSNAVIQGSRVTANDPWLADSGAALPFVATIAGIPNVAGQTRLLALNTGSWQPFNPGTNTFNNAVCEIP
jgi:hypothetical protein